MKEKIVNGLKITQLGEIVDAETGKQFGNGNLKTGITWDTSNSEVKTLEEMGCDPITETEEEYKEAARRQGLPYMKSSWEIIYEHEHPGEDAIRASIENNGLTPLYDTPAKRVVFGKSKYEVRPDTSFIVRFGIKENGDGKFMPVTGDDMKYDPEVEEHWAKFRMWSYDEKVKWRTEFMEFNTLTRSGDVNVDKLNERKIRMLLLDWSFGNYGDDMKLLHCDGRLSEESYSLFLNLYPSIALEIVSLMNSILDY